MLLYRRGQVAQLLPFRNPPGRLVAPGPHHPEELIQVLLVRLVTDKCGSGPCLIYEVAHWVAPFRISAIWKNLRSVPKRFAQPSKCIRHDISDETTYSAPVFCMNPTLS